MGEGDGRMRLRVTSHPVRGRAAGVHRILSTGRMLRNTAVYPPHRQVAFLQVNRADLLRIGALFRVAAVSPHSVVHIPVPPDAGEWGSGDFALPPRPLLLAREDTGLRPSDWPELRRRMGRGATPLTVTAPAPRPAEQSDAADRRTAKRPARFAEHAATIVITARAELLFELGDLLTAAGNRVATDPYLHEHGESYQNDIRYYFDPHMTDQPLHAFCVVVVDPIFHKARHQRADQR